MNITVIDFEGQSHTIPAEQDWPIMEAIRAAGLPIKAECGGCCLCATCHVYVDAAWSARLPALDGEEAQMLDEAPEVTPASRLSCQLRMSPELDGITMRLAPTY